jgi:hypothetical protein
MNSQTPTPPEDLPETPAASVTFTPYVPAPERPSLRSRIINWLVGITVLLIFAAIIIPTINRRNSPSPSSSSSNLRQVGQASLIYATDNHDQLPQVDDIHTYAFELARVGGLNDASIWIARGESNSDAARKLSTVLAADGKSLEPHFAAVRPSFAAAVRGLNANLPSTTPIAWTRGLQPDGTWSKDSPYGGEGGHIVFLGGNVSWFRKITPADGLIDRDGKPTTDIRAALPADAVIANN